ncbi:MAG: hypothetical protein WBI25_05485 [Smithellaceae bacterium]|nr:hypothetical protein [Smithellaceae bacterium]HQF83823.1 hypothetical protein [Smithellaceae bacterium]HQG80033.1 hypothetical protein [Smithellaceae bacterium]
MVDEALNTFPYPGDGTSWPELLPGKHTSCRCTVGHGSAFLSVLIVLDTTDAVM